MYRDGLPEIPRRLKKRPIERGYPVPWFVSFVDGHYDFRLMDASKIPIAVNEKRCWLCGEQLGRYLVFIIGPMCAINRVSSEPPSHRDCAEFSAKACPFLIQLEPQRRTAGLPEGVKDAAGCPIGRQPGVALLWITENYKPFRAPGGVLFKIGDPVETLWYREGRAATRAEVMESIETGYPILRDMAEQDGPRAVAMLEAQRQAAMNYLPA